MSRIIRKKHIKGTEPVPEFNVSKVRAMSDNEAEKRAKNDPDLPVLTPAAIRNMKVVRRRNNNT